MISHYLYSRLILGGAIALLGALGYGLLYLSKKTLPEREYRQEIIRNYEEQLECKKNAQTFEDFAKCKPSY